MESTKSQPLGRAPLRGNAAAGPQAGFTLIELLVAIVVTMIITGAMYGLLAGGQNAFRREPEITDRQQAIRLAMAMIQQDVAIAGQRMPLYAQAFTPGLDGQGTNDATTGPGPIEGPNGPTDILQLIGSPGDCPQVPSSEGKGVNVIAEMPMPSCYRIPGPVALFYPGGGASIGWGQEETKAGGNFGGANFPGGQQPDAAGIENKNDIYCPLPQAVQNKCPVVGCKVGDPGYLADICRPNRMSLAVIIRYVIAPDADGVPSLWRSAFGGMSDSGAQSDDPLTAPAGAEWRLIGRGVEDLQVQYRFPSCASADSWCDSPPTVVYGTSGTVVREVRVTLGARTVATNLAGVTTASSGSSSETAMRGQLVTVMSPRAILHNLSVSDPKAPPWY